MRQILALVFFLTCNPNLFATVYTWTNQAGDHKWSNPANWLPYGVPDLADEAAFNEYAKGYCLIDKPVHVKGIELQAGFTGTIEQAAGVSICIGEAGLSIYSGTFQLTDSKLLINGPFYQSDGTFQSGKSQVTFGHQFHISGGSFSFHHKLKTRQMMLKT